MKKRIPALAVALIIIASLLCGCKNTLPPEVMTTRSEITIITTEESFDSLVETFNTLRERVSKLIKEDGTGTISFGMHRTDVLKVLDEQDIPYEMIAGDILLGDSSYYGQGGYTGGGTYYHFDFKTGQFDFEAGQLFCIDFMSQSFRGLRVGDPVQRILELYGEPDEYSNDGMCEYYRYFSSASEAIVGFTVLVRSSGDKAAVYMMELLSRSAEEMEEY